jgi:hypothetical protein
MILVSQILQPWRYGEILILYLITFALRKNTERYKLKYYKIIIPTDLSLYGSI